MKRTLLALTALCGAVLIAAPVGIGVANAAQPAAGTGVVSVTTDGCREVTVTGELGSGYPSGARFELAVFVGPNNGGAVSDFHGIVEVSYDDPGSLEFILDRDSYGGSAFVKVSQEAGPDPLFADKVIVVDTSCVGDYPVTTTPTTSPVTTTPVETTTPAPALPPEDVDCDDVTDAQAQVILDADPSDPNLLDGDNDGNACDDEDGNFGDVGLAPRGGVATGG